MITKKVIDTIYKRYKKRPKSTDDLNIALLFEGVHPGHGVEIDGNDLLVNSVPEQSPFHVIPLSCHKRGRFLFQDGLSRCLGK